MSADNEEFEEEWGGKLATVIIISVIDWKKAEIALTACREVAGKCIRTQTQLMGVALSGTLLDDDKGLKHVSQLTPLTQVTLKELNTLDTAVEDINKLQRQWGNITNLHIADTLWLATRMFTNCKKKTVQQNLILVGSLPEPPDDAASRRAALKKAADLRAMNIHLQIILIGDDPLSSDSFYRELLEAASSAPFEWSPPPLISTADELTPLLWQNSRRKRAFCNLDFDIGGEVHMGVGLFYLCKEKSAPRTVNLDRETNERVVFRRQLKKADDTESEKAVPLLTSELCHYQNYGGKIIEFTSAERASIRKFGGPPSLKLLGFKSRSSLDLTRSYCKQSAFLFPDENRTAGAQKLFCTFRDCLLAEDKVMICVVVMRWHSFPRLVALVPQKRVENKGRQIQPDGFHVMFLPFAEEMKDIAVPENAEVTEDKVACAQKVVKKLRFSYSEDFFENPKHETLYASIEALALKTSEVRTVTDSTLPEVDIQCDLLGVLQDEFNDLFGPFGAVNKRKKDTQEKPPRKKKA